MTQALFKQTISLYTGIPVAVCTNAPPPPARTHTLSAPYAQCGGPEIENKTKKKSGRKMFLALWKSCFFPRTTGPALGFASCLLPPSLSSFPYFLSPPFPVQAILVTSWQCGSIAVFFTILGGTVAQANVALNTVYISMLSGSLNTALQVVSVTVGVLASPRVNISYSTIPYAYSYPYVLPYLVPYSYAASCLPSTAILPCCTFVRG